jgi:hypothetical protein
MGGIWGSNLSSMDRGVHRFAVGVGVARFECPLLRRMRDWTRC